MTQSPRQTSAAADSGEKPGPASRARTLWHFFWVTILALAVVTIALALAGLLRRPEPPAPTEYEIPKTVLESILSETGATARAIVAPEIDTVLDGVYAPAYAAIPAYADFHYSVLGEYSELTEAALGQMSASLYDRLFSGFEERLNTAAQLIDNRYSEAYRNTLETRLQAQVPPEALSLPLGEMTRAVLADATGRARLSFPLAALAAGAAGSGTVKALSAAIAKKLATKIAAKAAAKGAAKTGSALAGAGTGAALCAWSGPGAAVCGVVAGAAAWFLTDAAIIRIDEYFNREDFEAELRAMLDEDKAAKKLLIEQALMRKAADMDAATEEILKDFTLRELSGENGGNAAPRR